MRDLGESDDYATFDDRRGMLRLHYRGFSERLVEVVRAKDLSDASTVILNRGWEPAEFAWSYVRPERRYNIKIKRREP